MHNLYFVAGPNGSGKSTLINKILEDKRSLLYICPDNYLEQIINDERFSSSKEKIAEARRLCDNDKDKCLRKGEDFVVESVFSHPSHLEFLEKSKKSGYQIVAYYVTTSDPKICAERVDSRVKNGGHSVPKEKIEPRYYRSMGLLRDLILASDVTVVYDNSTKYQVVFVKENGEFLYTSKKEWVLEYIVKPLREIVKLQYSSKIGDKDNYIYKDLYRH